MDRSVWYTCVIILFNYFESVRARKYERCELAHDLLRFGMQKEHLATWVCLAYHESRFDTAAVNPYSRDYGILQISELFWCGPKGPNACGKPCSNFLDDNIEDDVKCALQIHREHQALQGDGFMAWVAYTSCVDHNVKKYLADCGDSRKIASHTKTVSKLFYNHVYYKNIDQFRTPWFQSSISKSRESKLLTQNHNNITYSTIQRKFDIDKLKLPIFNKETTISQSLPTVPVQRPTTELVFGKKSYNKINSTDFTIQPSSTHKPLVTPSKFIDFSTKPPTTTESPQPTSSQRPSSSTSVFDLYLRSTTAKPVRYSFAPFTGKRYRVQIFSGGSTTPRPLVGKYVDVALLKQPADSEDTHNRFVEEVMQR